MRKKEIVTLALTTVILMTTPVMPVSATEIVTDEVPSKSLHIITPQWASTNTVVPLISISGKKISVSVAIDPKKSTTTSVGTLYLEKKVGKGWTPAASWPIDAVGQWYYQNLQRHNRYYLPNQSSYYNWGGRN